MKDHLIKECHFYMTTCLKCEGTIAFKDVRQHYPHCRGRGSDVVIAASDARSLLEDFGNARNELQRALDSTSLEGGDGLKAAVASLSEQFARLQSQLAVLKANAAESGSSRPGK